MHLIGWLCTFKITLPYSRRHFSSTNCSSNWCDCNLLHIYEPQCFLWEKMVATCCNFIHLVCCFSRIPAIFSRSWQWEVRGFNGLTQSCQCTIRTAGYTASMRHNVSNDQIMCQSFILRTVWSAPSLGCYVCLTSKSKALNGLSAFLDHFLATFGASRCLRATFWLVNLYQSLSSAVPS